MFYLFWSLHISKLINHVWRHRVRLRNSLGGGQGRAVCVREMWINKYRASCVWCWQLGGLVLVITLCSYSLHSAVQELIPNSTHKAHSHSLLIASQIHPPQLPFLQPTPAKLSALLEGYTVPTHCTVNLYLLLVKFSLKFLWLPRAFWVVAKLWLGCSGKLLH